MCVGISFDLSREKLKKQFSLPFRQELNKSYHIYPSAKAYVLTGESEDLRQMSWGLVPYWAKDTESVQLTVAMSESIESKDSFRMPVRQHRCIVFADSFYDSQRRNQKEQFYRVMLKSHAILAMAGIWNMWKNEQGMSFYSFALISCPASDDYKTQGWSRMPVVFHSEELIQQWLNPETPLTDVLKMLKTPENSMLISYPISAALENRNINSVELHRPAETE